GMGVTLERDGGHFRKGWERGEIFPYEPNVNELLSIKNVLVKPAKKGFFDPFWRLMARLCYTPPHEKNLSHGTVW
ncbi:MAG: hypothetical protein WC525_09100, partial [Candidatus Thermoplasmatota archaeon]